MIDRSAVAIAEVIQDLQAARVQRLQDDDEQLFYSTLALAQRSGPVVDATSIYQSLADNPKPVYIYEDHPCISPPWPNAFIAYVNEHGNVIVMHLLSSEERNKNSRTEMWKSETNTVDWSEVRWLSEITIWLGGRSETLGQAIPVSGPAHIWQHAVYEKGKPADIRWTQVRPDYPIENWDMANLVLLGALNYMNCRNVELVEPTRPRAESRRIARTGVRVSTINVFPVGKSTRSDGETKNRGTPLTSVRGHFSCYGPDYNKGLLFGKLAGRFWIPQHARGDKSYGEIEQQVVLRPDVT